MLRIRLTLLIMLATLASAACGIAVTEPGAAPVSGQRCVGVPQAVCLRIQDEARAEAPLGAALVGIEIICTTTCTEANGDVTVTRTYANGQTFTGGHGWASPVGPVPGEPGEPGGPVVPEPTELPVEPTCIGIDEAPCLERAAESLGNAPQGAVVVSIDVLCTGTCTASSGDGNTTVRFADGTSQASGWSYRGP